MKVSAISMNRKMGQACQRLHHHCVIFLDVLQAGMWLNTEGEQRLKDSYSTDTLECTEKAVQDFNQFLTEAKVLRHCSKADLIKRALFGCITSQQFFYFPSVESL